MRGPRLSSSSLVAGSPSDELSWGFKFVLQVAFKVSDDTRGPRALGTCGLILPLYGPRLVI